MRILIIARYDENSLGGQAKFATQLGTYLRSKHQVIFLGAPYYLHTAKFKRIFIFITIFWKLNFYLIKYRDIQIVHIFSACSRMALYKKLLIGLNISIYRRKVIFNFRNAFDKYFKSYSGIEQKIIISILKTFDIVLSQYKKQSEFLISHGLSVDRVRYIYNGISEKEFIKPAYFRKNGLKKVVRILFLGEIGYRKGVDLIVDLLIKIKDKNVKLPDFEILLFGPVNNLAFVNRQKKIINKNGLKKYISFHKPVLNIEKYKRLYNCDIFLLPSRYEGFPNSVLEAFLYGKPVLVSNVGALDEIVTNEINGYKFEPGNTEEFLYGFEKLISSETLRKKIGIRNRNEVDTKYLIEESIKRYDDLYESFVNLSN